MKFNLDRPINMTDSVNIQRFAVAVICWCLAGFGIVWSFVFPPALAAWLALYVMTKGWVQGRRVHWVWPVVGFLIGVPSAALLWMFWPLYISAVPLAFYLVYFHLFNNQGGLENEI